MGRGPCPPLRDRILAALRKAGHPCTRSELHSPYGVIHRGEKAADCQLELEQLEAAGRVRRVWLPRRAHGPRCDDGWELVVLAAGLIGGGESCLSDQ